jgi:SulP family sulfate permease
MMGLKKGTLSTNDIIAGILSGFVIVILIIAFSALIFKGRLQLYLSIGLCSAIAASFLSNIINAGLGSIPFSIARLEPAVGAILAIILAHIAASITEASLFPTLIITVMLISLLTGFFMFFIGYFNFGQIIRFVPYPVLGGVIVGSALIMARSSLNLVSNHQFNMEYLTQTQSLLQLGISVGFALFLLVFKRVWMLPFSILLLSMVVILSLHGTHISTEDAINSGWLFSSFKPTFIFNSVNLSMFNQVDWMAIVNQSGYIFGLLSLIIILFLLNIGGIETAEKVDANLDQELKAAGVANIMGGLIFLLFITQRNLTE